MPVVGNFYFSIFLQLTWEFLGLESECEGSICLPNNKIIDFLEASCCCGNLKKKGENEHITPFIWPIDLVVLLRLTV